MEYHVGTEIIGTKGSIQIGLSLQWDEVVLLSNDGIVQKSCNGFLDRFEQAYLNKAGGFLRCILESRKLGVKVDDSAEAT